MRPYTNEEAELIASACRAYLDAHRKRSPQAVDMTLNEKLAVDQLRHVLAAREREALAAAIGTAA